MFPPAFRLPFFNAASIPTHDPPYGSAPECQQARQRGGRARWRRRPENQNYFRGPTEVERVRARRKAHPQEATKGAEDERNDVLRPDRVRKTPGQFSWVDHRVVRRNYVRRCDSRGWALYLMLVTVGDAQGLSATTPTARSPSCCRLEPTFLTRLDGLWMDLFFHIFSLCTAYNICHTCGMSNSNGKIDGSTERLLEERSALLEEMSGLSQLVHGSWVERFMVCSRPNCKCHREERHGPRHFLVVNAQGRQRQKYVAGRHERAVRVGLAQCRRLAEIVGRITQLNLALMKVDAYER